MAHNGMVTKISRAHGVSDTRISDMSSMMLLMARPHKGDRRLLMSRIPEEAYAELAQRARVAETSVSQFVADVMCLHIDRPDLVRELNRDRENGLPLAI